MKRYLYRLTPIALAIVPLAVFAETQLDLTLQRIRGSLDFVIGMLFLVATVVFLFGVISFISNAANEEKRKKAKNIMTWGILGLAVMAAAWGVARILIDYVAPGGLNQPKFVAPPTYQGDSRSTDTGGY